MTRRTIEPLRCDVCEGILIDGKCPTHPEAQLDPVDATAVAYMVGHDHGRAKEAGQEIEEPNYTDLLHRIALSWSRDNA